MTTTSENNKRIAKNTMFLYIRMAVIMLVQLYTSRVILQTLGVEDYGIYNIVGAVVVSLSFITGPLSSATQRFLSFELGKKNTERIKDIFSMSLMVYAILSLLVLILAETIGLWFLNNKMEIPPERLYAANWVFQCSILTFIINILNTPFNSAIIAYEKMSFYAYISIFEALARLAVVYFLLLTSSDKLIVYGILIVAVTLSVTTLYKFYCKKQLKDIKTHRVKDKQLLKQLLSFSGWSLFGAVANMSADQGLNLLLNLFFGVTVNAAMGVANQVSAAVNQFVTNFQTAFRPQIVKSYAEGNMEALHLLICRSSKFSFLLLFMVVCPVYFNIDYILQLWLGANVPQYTADFCRLILVYALIESLSAPLWMTVQATGKIKKYQLCISSLISTNIVLSYLLLKYTSSSPEIVLYIKCFMGFIYLSTRVYFMKIKISLSVYLFLRQVIMPITLISATSITALNLLYSTFNQIHISIILTSASFICLYALLLYALALNKDERRKISSYIKNKLSQNS